MLDPICNREITAEMLYLDMLHLRILIERMKPSRYIDCIPAVADRLAKLETMREEIGRE